MRYMGGARSSKIILGQPGIGKTYILPQVAHELNRRLQDQEFDLPGIERIEYRTLGGAANKDPIDLPGIPAVVRPDNGVPYAIRAQFKGNGDEIPTEGAGILAIEDISSVQAPVVMAGFQSLLHERRVGSTRLGDNWMVIATGNRVSDRAGAQRIITSMASRVGHVEAEPDVEGWLAYMAAPPEPALPGAVVARAFIKNYPQYFNQFDPKNDGPFPCARSWDYLSQEILAYNHSDPLGRVLPPDEVVAGWIGQGPMLDFLAFATLYRGLVTPQEILADPKHAHVPTEVGALYAVCTSLSTQANRQNLDRIVEYLYRLAPEYSVYAMRQVLVLDDARKEQAPDKKRYASIHETSAFRDFAHKFRDLMISV